MAAWLSRVISLYIRKDIRAAEDLLVISPASSASSASNISFSRAANSSNFPYTASKLL